MLIGYKMYVEDNSLNIKKPLWHALHLIKIILKKDCMYNTVFVCAMINVLLL